MSTWVALKTISSHYQQIRGVSIQGIYTASYLIQRSCHHHIVMVTGTDLAARGLITAVWDTHNVRDRELNYTVWISENNASLDLPQRGMWTKNNMEERRQQLTRAVTHDWMGRYHQHNTINTNTRRHSCDKQRLINYYGMSSNRLVTVSNLYGKQMC